MVKQAGSFIRIKPQGNDLVQGLGMASAGNGLARVDCVTGKAWGTGHSRACCSLLRSPESQDMKAHNQGSSSGSLCL